MSNPNTRKSCVVPKCTNTTTSAPEKLFFLVPMDVQMRKKWIKAMKRLDPFGDKSKVYGCEDYFDVSIVTVYYGHIVHFCSVHIFGRYKYKIRPEVQNLWCPNLTNFPLLCSNLHILRTIQLFCVTLCFLYSY